MTYDKTKNDRRNWFIDRIGKRVFRNDTGCECLECYNIVKSGFIIENCDMAEYLYEQMEEKQLQGLKIGYFDTMDEANEFMKS